MAPSRRKGASKAATAAACRQWKVGDLVLAKVKGFPAWPATVSEPEKWGYSADWKKVLVYFFGTQQIGFCNPADVEAFTEEKKESLLFKRHGKGADFVRAVHEIIDSCEKLKKHGQGFDILTSVEVTVANASKSVESSADSGSKDEAPASTVESYPKSSDFARAKNDPGFPIEVAAAAVEKDVLHNMEMPSEEPTGNVVVTDTRVPSTYSREQLGGIQALEFVTQRRAPKDFSHNRETPSEEPTGDVFVMDVPVRSTHSRKKFGSTPEQDFVTQKRAPSAGSSRSSSGLDSHKFHNFLLPSTNSGTSDTNVFANLQQDVSARRNKWIKKLPDVSEGHDMDSPFFSNGSFKKNDSGIVTDGSDTLIFSEPRTVESGCNLLQSESFVESCEGVVELSQSLDFQANAAVVKKKRKPSRKRVCNGIAELTGTPEKVAGLEIEVHKSGQTSRSDLEKLNGMCSKEDGDEHLPLVKRARVRMGRPSCAGEELDALIEMEEKSSEVANSHLGRVCKALNCEESCVDRDSFVVKGDVNNLSPSNKCSVNKPSLGEIKKHQWFGCSVDGEAALPPSKRLHRALEAMSANAVEDDQTSSECMEDKGRSESGEHNVLSFSANASQNSISILSVNLNPPVGEENKKSFVEVAACN